MALQPSDYVFKTDPYPPWDHQRNTFLKTAELEFHALYMEQRTGKTRIALDTAGFLYLADRIDAVLVIAPNGVHRQWLAEEVPGYVPPHINTECLIWSSHSTPGQVKRMVARLNKPDKGKLLFVSVNIDAIRVLRVQKMLGALVRNHRLMLIIDEALDVGNPKAERSKVAVRLARVAKIRRILEGTPAAATPMGLWNQGEVLSTGLLGPSYVAFRNKHAITEKVGMPEKVCPKCKRATLNPPCERCDGTGWEHYEKIVGYKDLPLLMESIGQWSTRVRRADCYDQPPKLYIKKVFELTPTQQQAYDDLRETFRAEVSDGSIVTAAHILTRYLRLQQITSNQVPTMQPVLPCPTCAGIGCVDCEYTGWGDAPLKKGTVTRVDDKHDPRLELLLAEVGRQPAGEAFIVWARFQPDVSAVCGALMDAGYGVGRYDGLVPEKERNTTKLDFQAGHLDAIVGSSKAGGRGLDLSRASTIYNYSHDWSLRARLQSEDRGESLKKKTSTAIVDLVAYGTVDEKILNALRAGRTIGEQLMRDPPTEWF